MNAQSLPASSRAWPGVDDARSGESGVDDVMGGVIVLPTEAETSEEVVDSEGVRLA